MSNWWYASSVDVTNGTKQVKVNDGEDVRYFERGSAWLKVVGHEAVETDGAFENNQGEKIVRLVKEWEGGTDTGRRATAFRTVPDFQGVADKLALNIQRSQEGAEYIAEATLNRSLNFTDNDMNTQSRNYRARVSLVNTGSLGSTIRQSVSIVTVE